MRIANIGGCNFYKSIKRANADRYFTIYNHSCEWASWVNRWKHYDSYLKSFEKADSIYDIYKYKKARNY